MVLIIEISAGPVALISTNWSERTVPNDTEDNFPKRFGPICAGSLALLLPDQVVAAAAGESACDDTASVDLDVESLAVWCAQDQHALRIHGPLGGAARIPHHAAGDR
jgi:hypothetical protein